MKCWTRPTASLHNVGKLMLSFSLLLLFLLHYCHHEYIIILLCRVYSWRCYAIVLHVLGAVVAPSTSSDCTANVHRQMTSASSRIDVPSKPVTSLNNGICAGVTPPSATQISLDTLFKGASRHCDSSEINLFRFSSHTCFNGYIPGLPGLGCGLLRSSKVPFGNCFVSACVLFTVTEY